MMNGYILTAPGFFEKYSGKKASMDAAVEMIRTQKLDTVTVMKSNLCDEWFSVTTHKPESINQIQVRLTDDGYKQCSNAMYERNGEKRRGKRKKAEEVPETAEIGTMDAKEIVSTIAEIERKLDEMDKLEPSKGPVEKMIESTEHPDYYGGADNPYELMKVFFEWGIGVDFCKGCVIKYLIRAGKKIEEGTSDGDMMALKDVKKALNYVQFLYDWLSTHGGY